MLIRHITYEEQVTATVHLSTTCFDENLTGDSSRADRLFENLRGSALIMI